MAAHNAQYQEPIKPSHQSFLHIQGLAPFELVTWHTLQQSGYRDVWDVSRPKNVFDEGFYNQQWSSTGSDEQRAIIKPRSMWWDSQQIEANVSGRGSTWRVESSCRPQTEHPGVLLLFVWHKHTHTLVQTHLTAEHIAGELSGWAIQDNISTLTENKRVWKVKFIEKLKICHHLYTLMSV